MGVMKKILGEEIEIQPPKTKRPKIVKPKAEKHIVEDVIDSDSIYQPNEAIINGVRTSYDLASYDENHYSKVPYKINYLGVGYPLNCDDISNNVELMHFWSVGTSIVEIENKLKEEELKMLLKDEKYIEVNKVIDVVVAEKGNPDALIDYCKIAFAEVFSTNGRKIETVEDEMKYILTVVEENDFFSDKQKEKFTNALLTEQKEYMKLAETLEAANSEVIEEIKNSNTSSSSGSDVSTLVLGVLAISAVLGLAYMAYRHFEPADVIIDMSTMDIMSR